jgi:hypothetical protein
MLGSYPPHPSGRSWHGDRERRFGVNVRNRVAVVAVGVASVAGGGIAGWALSSPPPAVAQEGDDTTDTTDATVGLVDSADAIRDALDDLVADGVITGAQADAVAEALADAFPFRMRLFESDHLGLGAPGFHEELEDLLGIGLDELRSELAEGKSLADIASELGIDPQQVIDDLMATVEERLDQAVENGRVSQERVDELLAQLEERITDMVNGEGFGRGPGFGLRPDRGFRFGERPFDWPFGDQGDTSEEGAFLGV